MAGRVALLHPALRYTRVGLGCQCRASGGFGARLFWRLCLLPRRGNLDEPSRHFSGCQQGRIDGAWPAPVAFAAVLALRIFNVSPLSRIVSNPQTRRTVKGPEAADSLLSQGWPAVG